MQVASTEGSLGTPSSGQNRHSERPRTAVAAGRGEAGREGTGAALGAGAGGTPSVLPQTWVALETRAPHSSDHTQHVRAPHFSLNQRVCVRVSALTLPRRGTPEAPGRGPGRWPLGQAGGKRCCLHSTGGRHCCTASNGKPTAHREEHRGLPLAQKWGK